MVSEEKVNTKSSDFPFLIMVFPTLLIISVIILLVTVIRNRNSNKNDQIKLDYEEDESERTSPIDTDNDELYVMENGEIQSILGIEQIKLSEPPNNTEILAPSDHDPNTPEISNTELDNIIEDLALEEELFDLEMLIKDLE
jgi:hypothetical protein